MIARIELGQRGALLRAATRDNGMPPRRRANGGSVDTECGLRSSLAPLLGSPALDTARRLRPACFG